MSDPRPPTETTTPRPSSAPERPISTTEVRQGVTLGHMRWVLIISLVLAVVALLVVYGVVI